LALAGLNSVQSAGSTCQQFGTMSESVVVQQRQICCSQKKN